MLERSVGYLIRMLRNVADATEKEMKAMWDAGFDEGYNAAIADRNGEEIEEFED